MKHYVLLACALVTACAADSSLKIPEQENESRLLYQYESSIQCQGCHSDQYRQYESSMHAKAFSNPLFSAQYFMEVVPRAQRSPHLIPEARKCLACHAPTVFMNYTGLVTTPEQANQFETGVTCDFCHTLAGYTEHGDYLQIPSAKKQGPFQISGAASHHSEYSGFMQLSEFCGKCHNDSNHFGLEMRSTYDEWRESGYGKSGLVCQECHMNKDGFLRNGTAEFTQGQAAYMNIGNFAKKQQEHDKLYNHSFPGAHSASQLEDALLLEFNIGIQAADAEGRFPFVLIVNNERSGHKMPSGSSDLRFMWLVVTAATDDGTVIPVMPTATMPGSAVDYSIAGASPDDAFILADEVPAGSRLFRTVMLNAAGRQSLFQYDAVTNVFDNRLDAAEIRKEWYYFKVPTHFSGMVTLEAHLYYKGAPRSFTTRIQAPDFVPVLIASQKKQVRIGSSDAHK